MSDDCPVCHGPCVHFPCRTCPKTENNVDAVSGPCCLDTPVSAPPAPLAINGAPEAWTQPELPGMPVPFSPRLWDARPIAITHLSGGVVTIGDRYIRQRCEWCGEKLIDYDLAMIAVPVGQASTPLATWPAGAMVRVDGVLSAVIENPEILEDNTVKLPPDCCFFDPATHLGR